LDTVDQRMVFASEDTTMTGMNEAQIRKLARLARLALTDSEIRALAPELAGIVRHVDALATVDVSSVEPMTHGAPLALHEAPAGHEPRPARAAALGDDSAAALGPAAVAASAGIDDDGSVRVPRVVDG
jgi:aspartyl-tRNA(Asn)/glutamyl-tRNA(Gln) amidotransferase subunit C